MTGIEIILQVLLVLCTALAAVTDIWKKRIYDWITLPTLALGLLLQYLGHGFGGAFDQGLVSAIFGAGFGALVFSIFLVVGRGLGGEDVKLMAAVGSLTGFMQAMTTTMLIACVGLAFALVVVVVRRRGLETLRGLWAHLLRTKDQSGKDRLTIPYGLAVFLGSLWGILMRLGH
jgi:Flp pilus assembly protein protease CpaA